MLFCYLTEPLHLVINQMKKNLLIIFRHPPFSSTNNRESLDIALACSAFDIPVSLLFINDGLLQLHNQQNSQLLQQKSLVNNFKALAMYDIEDYYVLEDDLSHYQLTEKELSLSCKVIKQEKMALLIRAFDTVINL